MPTREVRPRQGRSKHLPVLLVLHSTEPPSHGNLMTSETQSPSLPLTRWLGRPLAGRPLHDVTCSSSPIPPPVQCCWCSGLRMRCWCQGGPPPRGICTTGCTACPAASSPRQPSWMQQYRWAGSTVGWAAQAADLAAFKRLHRKDRVSLHTHTCLTQLTLVCHRPRGAQDCVALIRVPREALGITAASRGAVAGSLYVCDGPSSPWQDCTACGKAWGARTRGHMRAHSVHVCRSRTCRVVTEAWCVPAPHR